MRGHANLPNNNPDPEQPGNGEINDQPNPPPYEITLSPPDEWEGWIPTTGVGDSSDTETIIFTATTSATTEKGKITFKLSSVTSYQGRYMNDKKWNDHRGLDLYFAEEQAPLSMGITWTRHSDTEITVEWRDHLKTLKVEEFPVNIVCNDHAAYGEIHAILKITGFDPKSTAPHTIPQDVLPIAIHGHGGIGGFIPFIPTTITFGNKIADAWERGALYWDTTVDNDTPGSRNGVEHGANTGDGFSVHEEYRGFKIGGEHQRLIPTQKRLCSIPC